MDASQCITLSGGNVEYSLEEAAVEIDSVIELLESAKSEGATHVTLTSGNYRGAQWARMGTMYGWADEE